MYRELLEVLRRHRLLAPLFIFVLTFAWASWFWPSLSFPDGDSFYHIKITEMLSQGILRDFPWLPYSSFATNYIDHHFLYHLFLFPFITLLDPFVGAKLASITLVSSALTIFYIVVRNFYLRAPGFFTLLLATAPSFFFRANLAKAPAFSLIFLLLGLLALKNKKPVALGLLAFFYVWAYDGWPLLPLITIIWIGAQSMIAPMLDQAPFSIKKIVGNFFTREHRNLFSGVFLGTLAGIIINPYFPTNLSFYWLHIVKIGLVNYQSTINVGAEWYPPSGTYLLGAHTVLLSIFAASVILLIIEASRQSRSKTMPEKESLRTAFALFIIAAVFMVFTLKSIRNVDYSIALSALATSAIFSLGLPSLKPIGHRMIHYFKKKIHWLLIPPLAIILFSILTSQTIYLIAHRNRFTRGYPPDYYQNATEWLVNNVPRDSILFHTNWDTFPLLWYGNDRLRYIIGMDSTFLYDRDPERYRLWYKLVYGEYAGNVADAINDTFQANYIFFDKNRDHDVFEKQLLMAENIRKVYEDGVSMVFRIEELDSNYESERITND